MTSKAQVIVNTSSGLNKLVIIGNGFDLAHNLKTSYKNFLDWYMCEAFQEFRSKGSYSDALIEIKNKYTMTTTTWKDTPNTLEEVLSFIGYNDSQSINYESNFFNSLIGSFKEKNWIDIEQEYFALLKEMFSSQILEKKEIVYQLNKEFDCLIEQLSKYIKTVNELIIDVPKLNIKGSKSNLNEAFNVNNGSEIKFLNFNYTETLYAKRYAKKDDIIHIHGRAADLDRNPIIFGYGDESDPVYQNIEDSGDNVYLEHIKSFGYFRTGNYHKLLSYINSAPYIVYIVGHSCGLSDRILLNEIFEHQNCLSIDIFYHIR